MTKILVIDDERSLLEEVIDVLTFEGFDVIAANNGSEGVRMAMYHMPDLILCDVMMPVLDGYGVIQELQNYHDTRQIPFIFLTAKAGLKDLRYGMNLGADDYLMKPFQSKDLLATIRTRLDKQFRTEADQQNKIDAIHKMLVTTLPHELRTPLTSVLGSAQVINYCAGELSIEETKEYSDIILRSGQRLQRLVENYILFAQLSAIEEQHIPRDVLSKKSNVSFPSILIKDLVTQLASDAERYHDIKFDIKDDVDLAINPDFLRKIVTEIIDNAMKFSESGTKLRVSTRHNDKKFMVSVVDAGRGMNASQIKQIGPFIQFDRQHYEQQGSGLGLAIVKKLVELHHGKFTIDSQPERGTRVMIELPLGTKSAS